MEALQMLKFHLKKARLNFTETWMTSEKEMLEDEPDDDLLQKLFEPGADFQDSLDKIIKAINNDED
jgi:hypothetical protein